MHQLQKRKPMPPLPEKIRQRDHRRQPTPEPEPPFACKLRRSGVKHTPTSTPEIQNRIGVLIQNRNAHQPTHRQPQAVRAHPSRCAPVKTQSPSTSTGSNAFIVNRCDSASSTGAIRAATAARNIAQRRPPSSRASSPASTIVATPAIAGSSRSAHSEVPIVCSNRHAIHPISGG